MALYGTGYPQFKSLVFNPNAVLLLEHSVVDYNWSIPQFVVNDSIQNGVSTWNQLNGDFAEFKVTIYAWKYVDPADTMNTLLGYNHDTVNFMPHHTSGLYCKKDATNNAEFFITQMEPMYLRNQPPDFKDLLKITFTSTTPVSKSYSLPS